MAPVSKALNVACLQIAGRLWPKGWDVTDVPYAPSRVMALLSAGVRLQVWNGACEDTIFDDVEVNCAFRAWHDYHHFTARLPFTLEGEREVAKLQVRDLVELYGREFGTFQMATLVLCEVIAQAEHVAHYGTFVGSPGTETQRLFTLRRFQQFYPMARHLVYDH